MTTKPSEREHREVSRLTPTARERYANLRGSEIDHATALRIAVCATCGGTGQRATARSATGRELERHERSGTPCDACGGTGAAS